MPCLRIWADGKPLDLSGLTLRIYTGSETQTPDPLIVAKEGDAPAYRGLAYVVFERLPLASFGNRIPQLSFEIVRPVGRLEQMVRAVTLIPGATEFGYAPQTVVQMLGPGQSAPENRHIAYAPSDVVAALDELQAVAPHARARRDRRCLVRHRFALRVGAGDARHRQSRQTDLWRAPGRSQGSTDPAHTLSRGSTAARPSAARRQTRACAT